MKKEKNTNQDLDNQEKLKEQRLQLDTLIEEVEQIFIKHGMKIKAVNQTGSFVYFPKPKNPLKDTQEKK